VNCVSAKSEAPKANSSEKSSGEPVKLLKSQRKDEHAYQARDGRWEGRRRVNCSSRNESCAERVPGAFRTLETAARKSYRHARGKAAAEGRRGNENANREKLKAEDL